MNLFCLTKDHVNIDLILILIISTKSDCYDNFY